MSQKPLYNEKTAVTPYLVRLNTRLRHPPADPYYIKRDQRLLTEVLEDRTCLKRLTQNVESNVRFRFELFPIVKEDLDHLRQ